MNPCIRPIARMRPFALLLLLAALAATLAGCTGGGGGGGYRALLPPPDLIPERVLAGISTLTGSAGRFAARLESFGEGEEAVVVVASHARGLAAYTFDASIEPLAASPAGSDDPATPGEDAGPSDATPPPSPAVQVARGAAPGGERIADRRFRAGESLAAAAVATSDTKREPQRAPARAIVPGERMSFWSLHTLNWPPTAADWVLVTATCRAVGDHAYLFEDDATPQGYRKYPEEAWPVLRDAFDTEIHPRVTATFGREPRPPADADGDPRIFILFTAQVNKQYASGYFDSTNQLGEAEAASLQGGLFRTNRKEMIYMQVPSATFGWGPTLRDHVCGVMAHEFLHMIVFHEHVLARGSAANEEDWLNEGLAQVAQDVAGYGMQKGTLSFVIEPFLARPGGASLVNFRFSLAQYGMSYLFVRYLADRGADLGRLTATARTGVANVEAVTARTFESLFTDFCLALYLSGTGVSDDPAHRFESINLRGRQPDGTVFTGPAHAMDVPSGPFAESSVLWATGVQFLRFRGGPTGAAEVRVSEREGGRFGTTVLRFRR